MQLQGIEELLFNWTRVAGDHTLAAGVDPPGIFPASICSESNLCNLFGGIFSDAYSESASLWAAPSLLVCWGSAISKVIRYEVLLWPTFCSVLHNLAFIGALRGAKHDTRCYFLAAVGDWLVMMEYKRELSLFFQRLVWTSSGIDRMLVQQMDFSLRAVEVLACCWSLMLLSFTSLAKVFLQRCSHESCDVLYIRWKRGYVGWHSYFSSSAVVISRKCGVALKLSIRIGNMALQFQFSPYLFIMKRRPTKPARWHV